MESLFRFTSEPSRCGYLHDRKWSLEYEYVGEMSKGEYLQRMLEGWRRFGNMLFHPACSHCRECRAVRIVVDKFRPDRSQRRCRKKNEGEVELRIGEPRVSEQKLALYDRFHAYQVLRKGWPEHPPKDAGGYADSFVRHPFKVEEWRYFLANRLVGVGYVDCMDEPAPGHPARTVEGLSGIYFFHEPAERDRGLGTWNVLCMIEEAARRRLPYVYLGYYVAGSPSMEYKIRFVPNEIREPNGQWLPFRS